MGSHTLGQKLLVYIIYSIDDSVENSMGVGYTLGQKLLVQKEFNDSVENSMGGRPYPRTEAPGAETPEKRLYTLEMTV